MKSITEISDFQGKKVIVRVDWNVPITESGEVSDTSRIEVSIPTIKYIKEHNGLPIVMSHFGREGESIMPVVDFAKKQFLILDDGVEFLENLRQNPGEESNSEEFAKELADKAEYYVNDAFSVSHRSHASVVGVPKLLPSFAGLRMQNEIENLSKAFNPPHPFLFILGGAKLETKLPMVEKFINISDSIFIGGALVVEAQKLPVTKNSKIFFPIGDPAALDANQETIDLIKERAEQAKFILWNGPLGNYENGYDWGTKELAKILANCFESGAEVIVGGGDTEDAITELNIEDKFTFISLGGGAMLDFLAEGTLVGIQSLG